MCNPTLAISALSAGMQYQQAITQQKYQEQQAIRQNEIALANLEYRRKSSSLKLYIVFNSALIKSGIKIILPLYFILVVNCKGTFSSIINFGLIFFIISIA